MASQLPLPAESGMERLEAFAEFANRTAPKGWRAQQRAEYDAYVAAHGGRKPIGGFSMWCHLERVRLFNAEQERLKMAVTFDGWWQITSDSGWWSLTAGWIEDVAEATCFKEAAKATTALPIGANVRWITALEAWDIAQSAAAKGGEHV